LAQSSPSLELHGQSVRRRSLLKAKALTKSLAASANCAAALLIRERQVKRVTEIHNDIEKYQDEIYDLGLRCKIFAKRKSISAN
jgi:hypothetical protein